MSNMGKILVLQGGTSDEREVSLRSGANVADYLTDSGYEVSLLDPSASDFNLAEACKDVQAVLPMLHGVGGEDGVLQRQLEALKVPFLGSGSQACELTFDKKAYRDFVIKQGVQMAKGEVVNAKQFEASELRKSSYVLKPIDGGSSIDTLLVHNVAQEPTGQLPVLFEKYSTMLLEELIVGQELTVGVLGDEALPIIHIIPPTGEEFDYENKYNGRTAEIVNPTDVSQDVQKRAQGLALELHHLTGCRHLSRSDMIATPSGEMYVLETNTIPGMTAQSLFPKMAAAAGIDMPALVKRFVEMATEV